MNLKKKFFTLFLFIITFLAIMYFNTGGFLNDNIPFVLIGVGLIVFTPLIFLDRSLIFDKSENIKWIPIVVSTTLVTISLIIFYYYIRSTLYADIKEKPFSISGLIYYYHSRSYFEPIAYTVMSIFGHWRIIKKQKSLKKEKRREIK